MMGLVWSGLFRDDFRVLLHELWKDILKRQNSVVLEPS